MLRALSPSQLMEPSGLRFFKGDSFELPFWRRELNKLEDLEESYSGTKKKIKVSYLRNLLMREGSGEPRLPIGSFGEISSGAFFFFVCGERTNLLGLFIFPSINLQVNDDDQ